MPSRASTRLIFDLAECVPFVNGMVLFAANRDCLLRAAPQYRQQILRDIDICERELPCWLAWASGQETVAIGTEPQFGESSPRWWKAARVVAEEGKRP